MERVNRIAFVDTSNFNGSRAFVLISSNFCSISSNRSLSGDVSFRSVGEKRNELPDFFPKAHVMEQVYRIAFVDRSVCNGLNVSNQDSSNYCYISSKSMYCPYGIHYTIIFTDYARYSILLFVRFFYPEICVPCGWTQNSPRLFLAGRPFQTMCPHTIYLQLNNPRRHNPAKRKSPHIPWSPQTNRKMLYRFLLLVKEGCFPLHNICECTQGLDPSDLI